MRVQAALQISGIEDPLKVQEVKKNRCACEPQMTVKLFGFEHKFVDSKRYVFICYTFSVQGDAAERSAAYTCLSVYISTLGLAVQKVFTLLFQIAKIEVEIHFVLSRMKGAHKYPSLSLVIHQEIRTKPSER
jgi:hypothetical protein